MYWFYTSANVVALPAHRGLLRSHDRLLELDRILIGNQGLLLPWQHLYYMFEAARWQPFFAFIVLLVVWLNSQFFVRGRSRLALASAFWLVHIFLMSYLANIALTWTERYGPQGWLRVAATTSFVFVAGGFLAGLFFGLYLFVGARFTRGHADLAFSAIRVAGYKHFLRLRLARDGLTLYPIGLDKVPGRRGWRAPTDEERASGTIAGYVPKRPLHPHIIEGPIEIRPPAPRQREDS